MNNYKERRTSGISVLLQARWTFALIAAIAIFFALVVWPILPANFPGSSFFSRFFVHLGLDLQGGTHLVYDADLSQIPSDERGTALEGARDVIERRVNTLGVAEPVVQTAKQGGKSRILVELAGIKDVNQAIRLIGETPLLEFKETGSLATSTEPTSDRISEIENYNREKESLAIEIIKRIKQGESFESLAAEYSDDEANKNSGGDLGWVPRGVFTPLFENAIFTEMTVGELLDTPLKTEFGYHIIKKMEERTNADSGQPEVRSAHILLKTESLDDSASVTWVNTALSGRSLKQAQIGFDPQTNEPQVNLVFDGEGSKLFEEITARNVGKPVGIFLDGSVISAPIVNTVITGGKAVISGSYTLAKAKLDTQRLNAGALPVPINLISQQVVGASLGRDSLQKSLVAGLWGLVLVAAFMIVYYRLPGLLAVVALLLYAIITFGLFEIVPVTLTLAGIAGFILSIGMAVDANILIFERMKEELKKGESIASAIEIGFSRAWLSIRDSNISSLITCVILYWFGSSFIRGFAVTLGLGIAVSMYSAITVTRTFLRLTASVKFLQKFWLYGISKKQT
ncbi:MAG: protein translocase subunit SecD [Patescibacteria group bacterium]|mgnify:FL=1